MKIQMFTIRTPQGSLANPVEDRPEASPSTQQDSTSTASPSRP